MAGGAGYSLGRTRRSRGFSGDVGLPGGVGLGG